LERSTTEPELSIVIPAYNEVGRIEPTLDRVRAFLVERGAPAELLVVDDGSRDGTAKVVAERAESFEEVGLSLRVLGDGRNHGKGASLRTGMLAAKGRVVLFSDADLSAPIEEAPKLIDPIEGGQAAVVLGSRGLDRSMIGTHQPFARELAGKTFNLLTRIVTGLPFRDTQCGFKAFRRDAARDVFSRTRIDRFGCDVEILFLTQKLGYRAIEVPVLWNNVEGSKVSLAAGMNGYLDVFRVRANDMRGIYGKSPAARSVSSLVE
jgi:glycosyltransferase involved in cell wall biosynthesis